LQAVESQQQRWLTTGFRAGEQVVEVGVLERLGLGDHALVVVASAAVELTAIPDLEWNAFFPRVGHERIQAVSAIGDQ